MYWLVEMMSDCESKLNDPWIKTYVPVKGVESVHNLYVVKSGFYFWLKDIRVP